MKQTSKTVIHGPVFGDGGRVFWRTNLCHTSARYPRGAWSSAHTGTQIMGQCFAHPLAQRTHGRKFYSLACSLFHGSTTNGCVPWGRYFKIERAYREPANSGRPAHSVRREYCGPKISPSHGQSPGWALLAGWPVGSGDPFGRCRDGSTCVIQSEGWERMRFFLPLWSVGYEPELGTCVSFLKIFNRLIFSMSSERPQILPQSYGVFEVRYRLRGILFLVKKVVKFKQI